MSTTFQTTLLVPDGATKQKVYKLVMLGVCQAEIARKLRVTRATVSRHVKNLEKEGFLKREKTKQGKIKTIGNGIQRGDKANNLDMLISAKKGENNATGVSRASKKRVNVRTVKTHHLQYLPNVLKEGDYQFITKQSKIHNNTQDLSGFIECPSGKVKVHIHKTFRDVQTLNGMEKQEKQSYFYMYPPELSLTPTEAKGFEEAGRRICIEAIEIMTNKMGWKFGDSLPINPNWKPHHAIEDPHAQGLSDKFTLYSLDGKSWLSNSKGALEFEFSEINHALTMLDAPRAIEELSYRQAETETRVGELEVDLQSVKDGIGADQDKTEGKFHTITEELNATKQDVQSLVEISRQLCESSSNIARTLLDHKNTLQTISNNKNDHISNETPKNAVSNDLGGMYL